MRCPLKDSKLVPILDKMRENKSRLFRHVQWRLISAPIRRSDKIIINGAISIMWLKQILMEAVKRDDNASCKQGDGPQHS